MPRVAFAGTFAASLAGPVRRRLAIACDIVVADETAILPQLAGIDVLVAMAFTAEMGLAACRLKLLQVPGAGLDRIDRGALPPGAALANVYGHETGIAEYVIGAMISLTREFARLDAALRQGEWQSQWAVGAAPPPTWPELAGRTVGILGYGRIGREVARRARAFGMQVQALRRHPAAASEEGVRVVGPEMLEEVLRNADYLLIAMPATRETIGLLGRKQLRLMKPTACLINVARAEIVDEQSLYEALAGRHIAGAALDVWYRYPRLPGAAPPADQPFSALPNVLMTPHVAGWTDGTMQARAGLIADNIGRVVRGEPPLNLIAAV